MSFGQQLRLSGGRRPGERKRDLEIAAFANLAAHLQPAAMRFGDRFHNREAQAEAPDIAKAAGVGTTEAFEDPVEVLRRDAVTGIGDADLDSMIPPNRQLDPVFDRGVLHRVFNQSIDRQRQPVGIGIDHRLIGGAQPPMPRRG